MKGVGILMHLGMLVLFFFLYLGIIFLILMGFKRKSKVLKVVGISLLVIAIIFSIVIGIIYG